MTTAELAYCEECEAEIAESVYDAGDGLCPACLARTFQCESCGERTPRADAHPDLLTHCQCCGDSAIEAQHQERLDAASESLRELVETLIGNEDLDVIARALKSLRRLAK